MRNFYSYRLVLSMFVCLIFWGDCFAQNPLTAMPPRFSRNKKVIEYGGINSTFSSVVAHSGDWAGHGVDGISISAPWPGLPTNPNIPATIFFSDSALSLSQVNMDSISNVVWPSTLTDIFLSYRVTSDMDWWDDTKWETILMNVERIGEVFSNAGPKVKGIIINTEADGIWEYDDNDTNSNGTFEEWQTQVYNRGISFTNTLASQNRPDIKILMLNAWHASTLNRLPSDTILKDRKFALLESFCNGMLNGGNGQQVIIDGHEKAYSDKLTIQFHPTGAAAQSEYNKVAKCEYLINGYNDDSYISNNFQVSHGIRLKSYLLVDSFFNPLNFRHNLYQKFLTSDEYVWVYMGSAIADSIRFQIIPDLAEEYNYAKILLATMNKIGYKVIDGNDDVAILFDSSLSILSPLNNSVFFVGDTIDVITNKPTGALTAYFMWAKFDKYNKTSTDDSTIHNKFVLTTAGDYVFYALGATNAMMTNPIYVKAVNTQQRTIKKEGVMISSPVISPIPTANLVSVQFEQEIHNCFVFLTNTLGQIFHVDNQTEGTRLIVDISTVPSGIYILKVKCNNNMYDFKVVKE